MLVEWLSQLRLTVDPHLASIAVLWLIPLSVYILISGLDDLVLDLFRFRRRRPVRPERPPQPRKIAVFIPMWQEADVARPMLEHNLAALHYPDFLVFVGVYPNDPATAKAVHDYAHEDARVQICWVNHDGPTSKADCLNAIWDGMKRWEVEHAQRFDLVVLHDAEDLIHPQSLTLYDAWAGAAGMIQIPVLPLPTPVREFTHGVYCDDFAESQAEDLLTRCRLGGFLPGCGVGTAFRRDDLAGLAPSPDAPPFDQQLLTEDYDTGFRLYLKGVPQIVAPLAVEHGQLVATREYFPRRFSSAVRQRSRWVAGNSLQAWSRHGWAAAARASWRQKWLHRWFLWRDRKGLWGNPVSMFCNLLLIYGVVTAAWAAATGNPWLLREAIGQHRWLPPVLWINAGLFASRLGFRMRASALVYGWRFALWVPARMLWGNLLNCLATLRALRLWFAHQWFGSPLPWGKTAHRYPELAQLSGFKRPLEEVLAEEGYLTPAECSWAVSRQAPEETLGDTLLRFRLITEEQLYECLSIQLGLPQARLGPTFEPGRIACSIPESVQRRWKAIPYKVETGHLHIAVAQPPTREMEEALLRWTRLPPRYHLIPPRQFASLLAATTGESGYNPENEASSRSGPHRRRSAAAGAD